MAAKVKRPHPKACTSQLRDMERTHPAMIKCLRAAESNRAERLHHWKDGVRLKGYEELVSHLEKLSDAYSRSKHLKSIAFLISRARADFITCLEAVLSGFNTVAHDAMRDVMEIEFLLRDFHAEPSHINEWLTLDERARNAKFKPVLLRQWHAIRLGKKAEDLSEADDYKGHSMFLHVSPRQNPFGGQGITSGAVAFSADSGFWELFEHGRRILFAAHRLRRKLAPKVKAPAGPERGLKEFRNG